MDIRLNRGIEEVILLHSDDCGRRLAKTVYKRSRKRKKGTGALDPLGKVVRKIVASQQAAAKVYLDRHDESNRKKTDGWLRDMSYNVFRATRHGLKKVRRATGLPSLEGDD